VEKAYDLSQRSVGITGAGIGDKAQSFGRE